MSDQLPQSDDRLVIESVMRRLLFANPDSYYIDVQPDWLTVDAGIAITADEAEVLNRVFAASLPFGEP